LNSLPNCWTVSGVSRLSTQPSNNAAERLCETLTPQESALSTLADAYAIIEMELLHQWNPIGGVEPRQTAQ